MGYEVDEMVESDNVVKLGTYGEVRQNGAGKIDDNVEVLGDSNKT
jgi:hypothetical protein